MTTSDDSEKAAGLDRSTEAEQDELSAFDVRAVLQGLLSRGVSSEEVVAQLAKAHPTGSRMARNGRPMPTVSEYLAKVTPLLTPVTTYVYQPHLRRLQTDHGSDYIDTVIADDLEVLVASARSKHRKRRDAASADGRGAAENAVAAFRWFFGRAVANDFIAVNPAAKIAKPRRNGARRRALETDELEQLFDVVASGGNDPDLDMLLVRFHFETGARREGALNLKLGDVDATNQLVTLAEKFDKVRTVPMSRDLTDMLLAHAASRGVVRSSESLFRYKPGDGATVGAPLTRKRYETLFTRVQEALPWAKRLGVSAHWLRHTAGTAMERIGGIAVATEFLGHASDHVTFNYTRATAVEVCDAFSLRAGEQHPLATPGIIDGLLPGEPA